MPIKPVKKSLEFTRILPQDGHDRRAISTSLPLTFEGTTPPRPDPSHAASFAGGTLKRIGFDPGPIDKNKLKDFRKFVRSWLKKNITPLQEHEVPTFNEWIEETPYSRGRKDQLIQVWEKYLKNPTKRNLKKVKSFIKDECYNEWKYPRLINSRVDVAKCLFGPICAAASAAVFANPAFIKTIPVSERAKAIKEKIYKEGAECDSTDYTSYEAHFTKERMEATSGELFDWLFSGCSSATRRIVMTMMDVLTSDSRFINKAVSMKMSAVRCSGEMDTSLSNGFANAMTIEYLAHKYKTKAYYYVEGDDGIIRWALKDRRPPQSAYEELGLTIKIQSSTDLSELSFCGQVYDMDDLVVITDISEQLARLGWTNSKYVKASFKTRTALLRAKAYSLVFQYNGCPILSVLGRRLLELTEGARVTKKIINNWDPYKKELLQTALSGLPEPLEPKAATRLLVEKLYKIPIWRQLQIEEQFRTIELGVHPFPLETPKVWQDYYNNYSTTVLDPRPDWIKEPHKKEYENYISGFSNLAKFKF